MEDAINYVDENTLCWDCVWVLWGPTHWWTPAGQILGVRTPATAAALIPMVSLQSLYSLDQCCTAISEHGMGGVSWNA